MSEQDSALAIARLEGDRAAVRAEMEAMESRIDAGFAQMREDMAKRESRMIAWATGMFIAAVGILGAIGLFT